MRVTSVAYSKNLNQGKYGELQKQAKLLGQVRTEVWQKYGSIAGVGVRDSMIRDEWLKENKAFSVSANAWKETLRDAVADIKANREAAKVVARRKISKHTKDKEEQKSLFRLLRQDDWTEVPFLRRIMRKECARGHNHTYNQIIVRSYTEVYIDSDGEHYGEKLGETLSVESDYQKLKYQRHLLHVFIIQQLFHFIHCRLEFFIGFE
jgi:hypothetical protein